MTTQRKCDNCGGKDAHFIVAGYSETPTDRGMLREYQETWLCDDCADDSLPHGAYGESSQGQKL